MKKHLHIELSTPFRTGMLVRIHSKQHFHRSVDVFESWEYHESILPHHVGMFTNDNVGIVLDVLDSHDLNDRSRYYSAPGVKVVFGDTVGWMNGNELEIVNGF